MTLITNLHKEVEAAGGLLSLVARLQREARYAHTVVQTKGQVPLQRMKRTGAMPSAEFLGKPVPLEKTIRPLRLVSVDAVDDEVEREYEDHQTNTVTDDGVLEEAPELPVECDDFGMPLPEEVAGEAQESDMSDEIEKGAVGPDVVTDDAE